SYMERTITNACGRQSTWYNVGAPVELKDTTKVIEPVWRDGYQMLSVDQQIQLFKGCVYIAESNRIFTPNGAMLKSEQFNAMYGGYSFVIDQEGEKTTKKAWEAFTESQSLHNPKVDAMIFRPDLAPGSIVELDGWRYVNTYVDINVPMVEGDVTPFTNHLKKLLPNERDRTILLSYMAACVQHKGYKIQWAPLLQGVVGNGKTLLTRCVANAIGKRYVHWPKAAKLDSEFNAWLAGKIFIAVEDIFVSQHRSEILETIKPMITGGDGIEIQRKGVDQASGDICCNFMFNTNHKDALKDVTKDRRFCVFYTAQQEKIDLIRDGMDGDYMANIYNWLKDGGYAKVAKFLNDYAIPAEFNPTLSCQTAPTTSSTAEAAALGMGSVEQEIMEAIDEGRLGFAGGWVSSFKLDALIDGLRKSSMVPRSKRRELMRSLGYDYHPGLKDGRVNNVVAIENGKPRLYIRAGHIHANLTNGTEIARQYAAAQGDLLAVVAGVDNSVKSV
ncbi:MAG: primase-helicase family protein, partial [Shewanella sp.]